MKIGSVVGIVACAAVGLFAFGFIWPMLFIPPVDTAVLLGHITAHSAKIWIRPGAARGCVVCAYLAACSAGPRRVDSVRALSHGQRRMVAVDAATSQLQESSPRPAQLAAARLSL